MPAWLAALVPIIVEAIFKVLSAIGVYFVATEAVDKVFEYFWDKVGSYLNGLPVDFINLFYLSGAGEALNILIGAYTLAMGWKLGEKTMKIAGPKGGKK